MVNSDLVIDKHPLEMVNSDSVIDKHSMVNNGQCIDMCYGQ